MELDGKIADVYKRIQTERKMLEASRMLQRATNNADVLRKNDAKIREAEKSLQYFEDTLRELQQRKAAGTGTPPPTPPAAADARHSPESPHAPLPPGRTYGKLDLIKADTPHTPAKIARMLHQLEFKLQVEMQYRRGIDKMAKLYQADGDKKSRADAESKRVESEKKIQILNTALKRYKNLHVIEAEADDDDQVDDPADGDAKSNLRSKPLSGKLQITIKGARELDHAPVLSGRRSARVVPDTFVALKVEGTQRARTHPSRTDRWQEEFEIVVDKANEVEVAVFDKAPSDAHPVPIGYLWIKIPDLVDALRRQRVGQQAAGQGGWATAGDMHDSPSLTNFAQGHSASQSGDYAVGGMLPPGGVGALAGGPQEGVDAWFSVEPVGALALHLNFIKENVRKRPLDAPGGLARAQAVRKRKEEVHEQNGHAFIAKQFYQLVLCAFCSEFLLNATGYQCEDCRYTCHKKCYDKVVTKCISKSGAVGDEDDEAKINHRIPHRFEPMTNIGTNWCCHCGYMLPLGRKNARRCTECDVTCHATCAHLVPDFCGMSMETANILLRDWRDIKARQLTQSQRRTIQPPARGPSLPPIEQGISDDMNRMRLEQNAPPVPPQHQHSHSQYQGFEQRRPVQQQPLPGGFPTQSHPPPGARPPVAPGFPGAQPYDPRAPPAPPPHPSQQQRPPPPPAKGPSIPSSPAAGFASPAQSQQSLPSTPQQQAMPPPPQHPAAPAMQQQVASQRKKPQRKVGLDDFNFLAVLGKGNFGKVMLAEEKSSSNLYAIKVLKKEFIIDNDEVESTRSEKRVFLAAARERHPFLLGLHSCFQTETRVYFVMEYVSGGDLMLHIQRKQFSLRQAKFYAAEVLLALEYFHAQGIIYRDLKLDNILLTLDGHVKVADYGLCKEEMWYGNTTSTFCGTPEFMAPEILLEQRYGRAVDWWAFGVLMYEMLLGQSPFRGDDEDEIFDAILEDEPLYPITMPRDAVSILQKLLTRDPTRRLGAGEGDAAEIKRHPFFKDVSFDDVMNKRIPPPYFPTINGSADTSNFDEEFTKEQPTLTPVHHQLSARDQSEFNGFSWVASWADVEA
ncbi:hypothetical protein PENSPDRAFT_505499 [Peniophora sp. CONT]|nr:hypothetical protein PENSPDRAFT_505499 [Peniophora sp. CONT]